MMDKPIVSLCVKERDLPCRLETAEVTRDYGHIGRLGLLLSRIMRMEAHLVEVTTRGSHILHLHKLETLVLAQEVDTLFTAGHQALAQFLGLH